MRALASIAALAILLGLLGCETTRYQKMAEGKISVRTDANGRVVEAKMIQSISPEVDQKVTAFALANWRGPANSARIFLLSFERPEKPDLAKARLGDPAFRTLP